MIQLTNRGVTFSGSTNDLEGMRAQFERNHFVRLPQLLEPSLLDAIQVKIECGDFQERVHQRIEANKELCLANNAGLVALMFLANDEGLFQVIEKVTGCNPIGCFEGRVYRVSPGQGHHDAWHNDVAEDRMVGMSVNLSKDVYEGGLLQIRDHDSRALISEAENQGPGDALVFRLSADLQHRISEVKGHGPKTAFAGWFRARPDFSSLLRESYRQGQQQFDDVTFQSFVGDARLISSVEPSR